MFILSDGSDLKGVHRVLDIKYIKVLRLFMRVNGIWPDEYVGDTPTKWTPLRRYLTLFCSTMCYITGQLYLKENIGEINFFDLGQTYITVLMTFVSVSRHFMIYRKSYKEISRMFVTEVHLFNWKDDSEYAMEIHLLVHKISHFFVMYLHGMMFIGVFMFNLTPLYNNYSNDAFTNRLHGNATLEHAVYYWLPFDYTTLLPGYIGVFIYNWIMSFVCCINFCAGDIYMSILVFHIWGHLKILINNLEKFPKPSGVKSFTNIKKNAIQTVWYNEDEKQQVIKRLRELVKHHCLIIKSIRIMSSAFGYVLFVYLGFHQVCGCILLLECSSLEPSTLTRFALLTAMIFQQLIQISVIFEQLGIMAEKLTIAVYNLPWECMELRNRRIVHIMLRQSQLPLRFKALNMIEVGGGTMVQILKTSISYFLMLQTFATKN
ncbi:hypothetical protein ABMA28_000428 [Loxostege sticticalis]|uniref:Odorant receptor n=1 Tax=Loxostege sticticalis TaxID=481309 RepID=A0ABD0TS68_LOXSC